MSNYYLPIQLPGLLKDTLVLLLHMQTATHQHLSSIVEMLAYSVPHTLSN